MSVTFDHDILVDFFRQQPRLAVELLRRCADRDLRADDVELVSIDLSQVVPIEYRADALVVLRDAGEKASHAIVVEVQLAREPRKRYTWPVYLAVARAQLECPVTLLVIAPEVAVARWAATPIFLGGGFTFAPTVLALADIAIEVDRTTAEKFPELAVLAALARPSEQSVVVALDGIQTLPEDAARLYFDLLAQECPVDLWRMLMEAKKPKYEYRSEFARTYVAQGREAGAREARAEILGDMLVERFGPEAVDVRDSLVACAVETTRQIATALAKNATLDEIRALVREGARPPTQIKPD